MNKQKNLAFSYNHRKLTQMTNTDKAKIMLSSNNKNKDYKRISQLLQGGRQTQTAVVQLQRESRVVISHVMSGCLLTPDAEHAHLCRTRLNHTATKEGKDLTSHSPSETTRGMPGLTQNHVFCSASSRSFSKSPA